jgi:hypothetical protein
MPEPIRSQVLAEQPLTFTEGVRGWLRRRGSLPHGIVIHGVRSMLGGFAITRERVVVSASKHVVVDLRFSDAAESGSAIVQISETGIRLNVDMAAAVRGGQGTLRLDYAHKLGPDELGRLPRTRVAFSIDENVAARLFVAFRWAPGGRGSAAAPP